ncbi:MAG: DUF3137 domain-containing protein [Bacteroidota bacterium]
MKTSVELISLYENQLKPALESYEDDRKELKKKYIIGLTGVLVPIAALFIFKKDITIPTIVGIFSVVAIFIYFLIQVDKDKKIYIMKFKEGVVKHVVKLINPDWKYNSEDMISQSDFMASNIFPNKISKYKGDDLVTGVIDKTDFQFSELEVKDEVKRGDKTEDRIFFSGLFAHADFNKEIQGETYVLPERGVKKYRDLELIKLENPEFEKYFMAFGTDQIESRYVLTPTMMEAMMSIKKKYPNPVYFSFKGSRVYLAMSFGLDLFEPKIFTNGVNFQDVELMSSQFRIIETIVHEMNLNTRIWTKD